MTLVPSFLWRLFPRIASRLHSMAKGAEPRHGLWVDVTATQFQRDLQRHAGAVRAAGIDELVFVLQSGSRDHRATEWSYGTPDTFAAAVDAARRAGISSIGAMLWPQPTRGWIASIPQALELVQPWQLDFLEIDIEDNWYARPTDYPSRHDAAAMLWDSLRREWSGVIAASTYPERIASLGYILRPADELAVQSYSQTKYGWSGRYGVGGMQRLGAQRVANVQTSGRPELVQGLACYAQAFEEASAHEAMRRAYVAARETQPAAVRWWSWKHAYGPKRNAYAADAIAAAIASV